MNDELPTQRVAGTEYRSCEWCGAAVSQLGTRTPRLYCKRSHRQRAYDARRYGEPMLRDRQAATGETSAERLPAVPAPAPSAPAVPDLPAAPPVVVPLPTPKAARRRAMPPTSAGAGEDDGQDAALFELPPLPSADVIESELARRVEWMRGLTGPANQGQPDA